MIFVVGKVVGKILYPFIPEFVFNKYSITPNVIITAITFTLRRLNYHT